MFVDEVTQHWYALYPWRGPVPAEVAVTIVDRVIALVRSKGRLKPGAFETIDLCAERGLLLAVASSSQYRLIDAALDHFGLRERFDLVHSAEDEDYGKPHPAVFITAASKLSVAPRRCLVWEDAPAGVLAAKAASMACIAVPERGEGHDPAFALADLVVDSLLDVDGDALDSLALRRFGATPVGSDATFVIGRSDDRDASRPGRTEGQRIFSSLAATSR